MSNRRNVDDITIRRTGPVTYQSDNGIPSVTSITVQDHVTILFGENQSLKLRIVQLSADGSLVTARAEGVCEVADVTIELGDILEFSNDRIIGINR